MNTETDAVELLTQRLKEQEANHVDLKNAVASAEELRKQWTEHLATLKKNKPDSGDAEAVAEHKAAIEEAKANEAVAKEGVKGAKESVKQSNEQMRETKAMIKEARAEAKKSGDAAQKAEERAAREAWKAANTQNGMTRPQPGTIGATLWDIFDSVSSQKGSPAAIDEVRPLAEAQEIAKGSITSGYAHWRKFHGLTGRIESAETIAAKEAKAQEKAAKAAEREAKKAEREAEKARKAEEKAAAKAAKEAEAAQAAE